MNSNAVQMIKIFLHTCKESTVGVSNTRRLQSGFCAVKSCLPRGRRKLNKKEAQEPDAKSSLGHIAAGHRRSRSKEDGEGKMNEPRPQKKEHEDCNRGKQQDTLQRVLRQLQRSTAGVLHIA